MTLFSKLLAALSVAGLLVGCQTLPQPEYTVVESTTDSSKGTIAIRSHTLRGDPGDAGLTIPALFGLLFQTNQMITDRMDVFDVTHEPRFLGSLTTTENSYEPSGNGQLLQYDVEQGRRVLMVVGQYLAGFNEDDFVEVDVVAGQITHVSVSRYGTVLRSLHMMQNHLLGPQSSRACATTKGLSTDEAKALVQRLDGREIKHAAHFCWLLSSRTFVSRVPEPTEWSSFVTKEQVAKRKAALYPVWKNLSSKVRPYSLRYPDRNSDHLTSRPNAGGSCAVC